MAYTVRSLKREKADLLAYQERDPFHFYVHAPYIINLASDNSTTRTKSTSCLQTMLDELSGTNSSVVLHTGSRGSLTDVVEKLNEMTTNPGTPPVLLENADGAGKKLGKNFEELRRIAEGVDKSFKLGFCIDTAHIFTAGESDLSTDSKSEEIVDFLSDYSHRLIHLNDSETPFSSYNDKHEGLGCGHIWGQSIDTLQSLLHFSLADSIPIILETPSSLEDMKLMSSII
jgi:apurinic endonuclease APN1